jgi:hypothetical protein
MFLGSKARSVCKADNHAAICKPIVKTLWILNISQPYSPPRPVRGIALRHILVNVTDSTVLRVTRLALHVSTDMVIVRC